MTSLTPHQSHGRKARRFWIVTIIPVIIGLCLILVIFLSVSRRSATPPTTSTTSEIGDFNKENVYVTLSSLSGLPLVSLEAHQENPLRPLSMQGRILRLPCRHQHYVFRTVMEDSYSRRTIEYVARGTILSADLPPLLRCSQPLPSNIGSRAELSLVSATRTKTHKEPIVWIEGNRVSDGSFAGKVAVTDEPCPADYRLEAHFRPPGRFTDFTYNVLITETLANGKRDGNCPH
jgi:hypothetical protein